VDSDSEEVEEVEEAEEADPLRKVVGRWHHPISCDPFSERTTIINSDLNLDLRSHFQFSSPTILWN
jgi:hypothetical protein